MRIKTLSILSVVFPPLLSGIILASAFPSCNFAWLGWIGLVPLFLAIRGKSTKHGFLLALVCGLFFLPGIFHWILELPGYTLVHHVFLGLYFVPFCGFFVLGFSFISRRSGITLALFAAPFIWVALEYIRSNLSFLALPWGILAHSQYNNPLVIQIASVTGAYGVSFLIVLVNSAFAALTYTSLHGVIGPKTAALTSPSRRGAGAVVGLAAALFVLTLFYGQMTVSEPIVGKAVKVAVVQGNIEQVKKWDRKYANFIMQTYANLTEEASKQDPALIIWPETATPAAINLNPWLDAQVRQIAENAGTYLLLGSSRRQKFKKKDSQTKEAKYVNSAFLIPPEGKAGNQRYDKIRLLPFGEYLPLEGTIPWAFIKVPEIVSMMPGKDYTVFQHPRFRFGVTICWENIFPDLVRQFVKRGAQFIVNITNEAWFGNTAAPYQFLSMSVFRAVENRVYVVRCANTGVSCFIDPYGRVVDRVKNKDGQDIFVRGLLTGSIVPLESNTFYTRYGDWLAWLSILGSVIFLVVALLKKKH